LDKIEKESLHKLLNHISHLFDRIINSWKADPVALEWKYKDESLIIPNHIQFHNRRKNSKDEIQEPTEFEFLWKVGRF
jgi:hypothetical protein